MRVEKAQHTARARITCPLRPLPHLLSVLLTAVSLTTPAAVPAQRPAQTGAEATKAAKVLAGEGESIRTFRVRVPEERRSPISAAASPRHAGPIRKQSVTARPSR